MTDKRPPDEPGADERFNRGIANALKMPAKSQKPQPKPPSVKDEPKVG